MSQIMKKLSASLLVQIMLLSFVACESRTLNRNSNIVAQNTKQVKQNEKGANNTMEKDYSESTSKVLVAYFSLAGEQYNVGVIEEGNTSIVAHMIAEQTGADLFEIEAVNQYPKSHRELLNVSQKEMSENARPEIAGTVNNMNNYETIFIGYPNWWGDMPMIVYNFVESYDFSGKTIVPFCTHGGSGLSRTERTIKDITGASMIDGFAIPGETAQNNRKETQRRVTKWLQDEGLIK